jgi:hypothetical protein
MMGMWYSFYDQESTFDPSIPSVNPHVPDISTERGLLDIMAVGNLLECAMILDRRSYGKSGLHWHELAEIAMARWWYRMLQIRFDRQYVVTVGGNPIAAISVFRRSLVEFAASLVVYKCQEHPGNHVTPGCTGDALKMEVMQNMKSNHPELLPCLERLVSEGAGAMYWTGPQIEIQSRSLEDKTCPPPPFDFEDQPIYREPSEVIKGDNDDVAMQEITDSMIDLDHNHEQPKKSPRRLRSHPKGDTRTADDNAITGKEGRKEGRHDLQTLHSDDDSHSGPPKKRRVHI